MAKFRTEKDSLGTKKVLEEAYYGIHTQRSKENFPISNLRFPKIFITSLAIIKLSCASANMTLGHLDKIRGKAIMRACNEIIHEKFHDQFILDIFQSGSGTSTNMNSNEVIANRASELLGKRKGSKFVHPNDHVNMGQSTNDVFPTAIRLSSLFFLKYLIINLKNIEKTLLIKSNQFKSILKSGRTHLQDAVPITLGQEFHSYATMISKHIQQLNDSKKYLFQLGIGGNAVGTGINTHPHFRKLIIKNIKKITKLKVSITKDSIESTNNLTDIAYFHSTLKTLAVNLNKISNDLRLMSSGPKTGFNEINLPALEPGSSIMPGKVNPSVCEALNMVCNQVFGNDVSITIAAQSSILDLSMSMPLIAYNTLQSLEILSNAVSVFDKKCIRGITANKDICYKYFETSLSIATALNPYLGYDKAATLVKESLKSGKTIKELVLEEKLMTKKQLDKILDQRNITKPNLK